MKRLDPRSRRVFLVAVLMAGSTCGGKPSANPLPRVPNRIVSQTILSDDVLWELGADLRGRVVGVSALADDARYSPHPNRWADSVPRISTTGEGVLALQPDLAILASFTAAETRALIAASGVHALILEGFEGFESYRRHVAEIGSAVGDPDGAARLVTEFDTRLQSLQSSPATRPSIVSYNEGMVPAAGTTFHDEAQAAGFINGPSARGLTGHTRVTLEQISAWDPAFIVVPCGRDCVAATASVAALPGLAATRAVRSGHIVPIPSHLLFSTGPDMLGVVQHLAAAREAR